MAELSCPVLVGFAGPNAPLQVAALPQMALTLERYFPATMPLVTLRKVIVFYDLFFVEGRMFLML